MKIAIASKQANARELIRRAGYAELRNRESGGASYVRRLRGDFYPRFHAYLEEKAESVIINLHLDQKQPSYGGSHAHSGEYDGPTVEQEAARIKSILKPKTYNLQHVPSH